MVSGEGRDILIVGAAAPIAWSAAASAALADLGFRVINFDYGSGHSDPEPRTSVDQAEDVLDVARAVGTESAVLVGLSRGAITAYRAASDAPDLAAGLVLAFPVAGFSDTIFNEEPGPSEPSPVEMLRTVFSDRFLRDHQGEAAEMMMTPPGSVRRVDRAQEQALSDDAAVSCPVLVIEGGADRVVGVEHPKRYLSHLPDARHVLVPDASHGWLMEEPEEFARIVSGFCDQDVPALPESA